MVKVGDWVEADNGYGIVVSIFPRFYQEGEHDIPDEKRLGDLKQHSFVVKRFCSYEFKVRFQVRLMSEKLVSPVSEKTMESIKKLLSEGNTKERFEKYKDWYDGKDMVTENLALKPGDITAIEEVVENLSGNSEFTLDEVKALIGHEKFGQRGLSVTHYLQLVSSGLGRYRDRKMLFTEAALREK